MSRADVHQVLGRMTAARHDLRRRGALEPAAALELDFHRADLAAELGHLPDAASIYRRLLAEPAVSVRHQTLCANNLALIEASRAGYAPALRRLGQALPGAAGRPGACSPWSPRAGRGSPCGRADLPRAWVSSRWLGRIYRAATLPLGEHYIEYADALMELRLLPEAGATRRAGAEFVQAGVP